MKPGKNFPEWQEVFTCIKFVACFFFKEKSKKKSQKCQKTMMYVVYA